MSLLRVIAQAGERARLDAVLRAHRGLTSTHPWRVVGGVGEPAYQGAWYTGSPSLAFFRDAIGFVHFRGKAARPGTTPNDPIFYLPVGYRPANTISLGVGHRLDLDFLARGQTGDPAAIWSITIYPDGLVEFVNFYGGSPVAFDDKRFRAY